MNIGTIAGEETLSKIQYTFSVLSSATSRKNQFGLIWYGQGQHSVFGIFLKLVCQK
jgi:hypothetical protein